MLSFRHRMYPCLRRGEWRSGIKEACVYDEIEAEKEDLRGSGTPVGSTDAEHYSSIEIRDAVLHPYCFSVTAMEHKRLDPGQSLATTQLSSFSYGSLQRRSQRRNSANPTKLKCVEKCSAQNGERVRRDSGNDRGDLRRYLASNLDSGTLQTEPQKIRTVPEGEQFFHQCLS